jgi:hypothetical protein
MKTVVVAFDVDGTLRCNCTDTCKDVNRRIVDLLFAIRSMKNTRIMVWSGGGAEYARNFMRPFALHSDVIFASKTDKSTWKWGKPDIAFDDMQDCELGDINLIVREK